MIKNNKGILETFTLSILAHMQICRHKGSIIQVILHPQNQNKDKLFDRGSKIIFILSKIPRMWHNRLNNYTTPDYITLHDGTLF